MVANSLNAPVRPVESIRAIVQQRLLGLSPVKMENEQAAPLAKNEQLIRAVAHDLRNPLGGISQLVDVLMEDDGLNAEQRDLLNLVKESASYSLNLVHELLEKSFAKATPKQFTNIGAAITKCSNLLHHKVLAKRQQLLVHVPDNIAAVIAGNDAISRLLDNLLGNAIKFTPEGGSICISAVQNETCLEIRVQDNGIGIPKKLQNKLFKGCPGRKGTCGEQSFGLGLPICRQIVEEHGGRIWFQSAVGKGTTFYVTLPCAENRAGVMVA